MANEEHLAILKQGVEAWNRWRSENPDIQYPDLHETNLREADLSKINLREVDLRETDLSEANLYKSNLSGANLYRADLYGVNLGSAHLRGADLREAYLARANLNNADLHETFLYQVCLHEANLCGANLLRAVLYGADLRKANLTDANFCGADLSEAGLNGAALTGTDLTFASLTGADLTGASLINCKIYGISVWDVKLENTQQQNLIISREDQPVITVDNLEVAQFIYLLLHNEKLRDVINTIGQKAVLILGRFTPERKKILDALRDKLREKGYLPIIFDFEKSEQRDFTETIKILAGMSLFVIADITNPKSSPLELQATVPDYMIPFVPIIQKGESPFAMFADLRKYPWVLDVRSYEDEAQLLAYLDEGIIKPALRKHNELLAQKNKALEIRGIDEM